MEYATWCSVHLFSGNNKKLPWSSISSNVTFSSSWWHGKEEKKRQKRSKRMVMHVLKGKPVSDLILHAWCVGRNFCGYLILRFFSKSQNSENVVPANNSNSKVIETLYKRTTSVARFTNFSFELFYAIFTEYASVLCLYHGAKKSKITKNSNQGGGRSRLSTLYLV